MDKNLDVINYCAVTGLGNNYSQASIIGHTQTTFSWNPVNLWHLVILYTIYCLIPRPSADDYTASSYFNLMLITATSLSRPWLVTLSCLGVYFILRFQWISTNISILLSDKTTPLEYKTKMILLNKTTKSEIDQDKASFPSPSLLLPTSIVTLLLVLLCLSIVTTPTTGTTTQDVTTYLPSFICNNRDVTESSDSKLNQAMTQSTLSSIQFGNLKFEDRYETFWPSFTIVLC